MERYWSNNDELGSRENEAGSTVDGSVVNEGTTEDEEVVEEPPLKRFKEQD